MRISLGNTGTLVFLLLLASSVSDRGKKNEVVVVIADVAAGWDNAF